jgi:Rhodopirellula transposase DDE domain
MMDREWEGGKKDERLYRKVRAEKQKRIREKYDRLKAFLGERSRRLWAANEAIAFGQGGIRAIAEALEMSPQTVIDGRRELMGEVESEDDDEPLPPGRQRRPGGGRKSLAEQQPGLVKAIEEIVDPATRGDPMTPLKWTSKSLIKISAELKQQGFQASTTAVSRILWEDLKYSLQGLKKTKEGAKQHPDRDAQFQYLSQQCKDFQQRGQPVISVDAKKKELVGDFKNGGREWQPQGKPERVRTHDFEDKELGKGLPYGVFDPNRNEGWVSVGVDHDTAEFAVSSIRNWWTRMGKTVYPDARELLITADAGGSNGYRPRLWKRELQKLADETGLALTVCHFPPGTSKWNKIEHRMFCHITANWRGRPLSSLEVIVNLIAGTTTQKGLSIQADLDPGTYEKGIRISEEEMSKLQLKPATFHGEWNYTITSRNAAAPQNNVQPLQI